MAFIEASLEELPVSANLGQSSLATKISAPVPSSFGWFCHRHEGFEVALDFYVFDVYDFDILIGHPLEKLFLNISTVRELNIRLERDSLAIPITCSTKSIAESHPQEDQIEEVLAVSSFEISKTSLEEDAELFIQEEDDLEETLDLPMHK